ncbi:pentapeptide repeat-containing protein [Nostoc sp. NIES-2111]
MYTNLVSLLSKRFCAAIMLLLIAACARPGTGGPVQAQTVQSGRLSFVGQTFADSVPMTSFADKAQGKVLVLEFERCTFSKTATFTGAGTEFSSFPYTCIFKDCTFEGDMQAGQTQFAGRLNLVKCRFKKKVNFQNCTFSAPVGFRTCSFDGDASWNNSLFMREASFMDSHFFDVARLQACRFLAQAMFGNAVFHKNADLTLCRFDEGAWFDYGVFMGQADFGSTRALGPLSFRQTQTERLLLNNLTAYDKVNLSGLVAKDSTRLQGAVFWRGRP